MTLAELLKEQRRLQFLTQKELAAKLNVNINTVQRWELGETVPFRTQQRKLLEVLGITPAELLAAIEASEREKASA